MEKKLGDALRLEREKRGIELRTIAGDTNIAIGYLKALEEENLKALPSDFYVKYYIKSYLRSLGIDERSFLAPLEGYLERFFGGGNAAKVVNLMENVQYTKFGRRKFILYAFLIVAVATALATIRPWRWLTGSNRSFPFVRLAADTLPYYVPLDDASADFDPVRVSIAFSDRCWISVERGREKIAEKVCQKGENLTFAGYRLTISIGNPQSLEITVNGRRIPPSKLGVQPLRLVFTPSSIPDFFENS